MRLALGSSTFFLLFLRLSTFSVRSEPFLLARKEVLTNNIGNGEPARPENADNNEGTSVKMDLFRTGMRGLFDSFLLSNVLRPPESGSRNVPIDCKIEKEESERYTSSFLDPTFDEEESIRSEMKLNGGGRPSKAESNVLTGEHFTICWIETVTITEDLKYTPAKRFLTREYSVSFENSATIPSEHLDCEKMSEQEQHNDLPDLILDNTKVSKLANLTNVNWLKGTMQWQQRYVKCAVGPRLTESVLEWVNLSGQLNKKRLEFKVGPILRPEIANVTTGAVQQEPTTTTVERPKNASEIPETFVPFTISVLPLSENAIPVTTQVGPMMLPAAVSSADLIKETTLPTEFELAVVLGTTSPAFLPEYSTEHLEAAERNASTGFPVETVTTAPSTIPFSATPVKSRQRLNLKVKITLEQIDDNDDKQDIGQLETIYPLGEYPASTSGAHFLKKFGLLDESFGARLNGTVLNKLIEDTNNFINEQLRKYAESKNETTRKRRKREIGASGRVSVRVEDVADSLRRIARRVNEIEREDELGNGGKETTAVEAARWKLSRMATEAEELSCFTKFNLYKIPE